jgi:hypothetical protein
MPTETVLVVSGIVIVFALFAAVLMWGDLYTRRARQRFHGIDK